MSFESVRQILNDHAYSTLIGLNEDTWLEAKGSNPYNLDTPGGRYELAKDVGAFANNSGGFIIVGLATIPAEAVNTKTITGFDLCTAQSFEIQRYQGLIQVHIYPRVEGLTVTWVPVNQEGTQGLGIIEVPPQDTNRQYFLTAKVVEGGEKLREIVFGIARRNDASNDPLTREQLYRHMQDGKSALSQKLDRIDEKLDAILANPARALETADPDAVYAERATQILDGSGQ